VSDRPANPVKIRPWASADLALLERLLGDPAMMRHLGGPESPSDIRARHERYLASDPAAGGLFAIVLGGDAVGWVGYWESEWQGEHVWECGWHVVPAWQGQGVATAGTSLMIDAARVHGVHDRVHAFPSVGNAASNALCRHLGFGLLGEVEVEYPRGSMMRANDWLLDLRAGRSGQEGLPADPGSR
jgi:RimJ/RimL family protein N-acetyltransferase